MIDLRLIIIFGLEHQLWILSVNLSYFVTKEGGGRSCLICRQCKKNKNDIINDPLPKLFIANCELKLFAQHI